MERSILACHPVAMGESVGCGGQFKGVRMAEVRVAVPGASGWMGKVHTMAYQTFPHFLGSSGGTARVVALVEVNPKAAAELAFRALGAKILQAWQDAVIAPKVDLPNFALGYNESKIIEPTFEAGHHICQIVDACMESSRLGAWVSTG
jgi:hypothetical protein